MIGNNQSTNREEIPLNSSKVTCKEVVVTGTKARVNNKETSWITVNKTKATTGTENNEEITFIKFKNPFWLSKELTSPNWHPWTYLLLDMTRSEDHIIFLISVGRNICPEVVIYNILKLNGNAKHEQRDWINNKIITATAYQRGRD